MWSRYINEEEMTHLTDYGEFYRKLTELKREFANEFRSDYMNMLNLEISYFDTRYEMGVYTREDKQRFAERISRLILRDDRRKRRLRRRTKNPALKRQKNQ